MTTWVVMCGAVVGLGVCLVVAEWIPAPPRLDAALTRLNSPGNGGFLVSRLASPSRLGRYPARLGGGALSVLPWLPVPATDLALLGQDRERWLGKKVLFGLAGLAVVPAGAALLALAGLGSGWKAPAVVSLLLGSGLFFAPDLVVRQAAGRRRADFRHALASYFDLVGLERGAGAGPTEALEAAAEIGGGWAFGRIKLALDGARRTGAAPWTALAALAADTGVSELADLADIAAVAGEEGGRILDTLAARAASMRAQALAADRARAGARGTTMVVPIALLAAGFLLLLVFPIVYRTFGSG